MGICVEAFLYFHQVLNILGPVPTTMLRLLTQQWGTSQPSPLPAGMHTVEKAATWL